MKKAVHSLENKKVTAYFGHQDGLMTLLTMMGINEDLIAPTHDNYPNNQDSDKERQFRVSKMNPMGGNFGLLLSECGQEPVQRVTAYLHEKPIKLSKCGSMDCDWNKFKRIYKKAIQCPFDEICGNKVKTEFGERPESNPGKSPTDPLISDIYSQLSNRRPDEINNP